MEEIDIIELLQRVKEGNAPKRIEINGNKYILRDIKYPSIEQLYYIEDRLGFAMSWLEHTDVIVDTKIKILDKPKYQIITKVSDDWDYDTVSIYDLCAKVDEVIDYINNKENKDE